MSFYDLQSLAGTILPILLSVGTGIYAWVASRKKEQTDRIEKLEATIAAHDGRLQGIDLLIKQMPDKDSIHQLALSVERLSGDMRAMGSDVKAVREISIMTRDMVSGSSRESS